MALSVVVSLLGASWTAIRTNEIGDAGERIAQLTDPDDIVVWRSPFKAREFGELANGRSWLSAPYETDRTDLAALLASTDTTDFHWIGKEQIAAEFPGWAATEIVGELGFLDVQVIRFVRRPVG